MAVAGGMDRVVGLEGGRRWVPTGRGYERCKGKIARLPGMEFGEGVMWKRRRQG